MPAPEARRTTLRTGLALTLANARYWTAVAPTARKQLARWSTHAERIPDPLLKRIALTAHREEAFNAQATATLATLAPAEHRASVAEAIIALQVLYDYLDGLLEQPLPDPLRDGRQLYRALVDAIDGEAPPGSGSYYADLPWANDGDYLTELVQAVRQAIARLPSRTAVSDLSRRIAERCREAQARAHATTTLGDEQLERWAKRNAPDSTADWREFMVAAVSSGLALHALTAIAADADATPQQAAAIDNAYLPICAMTTLLDGLIDYEQDLQHGGQPGYIRYYATHDELAQALKRLIAAAKTAANDTANPGHHITTIAGILAYYTSSPTASQAYSRAIIKQIDRELRPFIGPTRVLMRAWRIAKRCGRPTPSSHRDLDEAAWRP